MIKKILGILTFIAIILFSIQSSFALQTYVGVKIINMTDDPTATCAGQSGYGNQGRIRAISSILPSYPIYYELRNSSGTIISSGNISDGDYALNETFYLPNTVDLTSSANYTLFFDVDAIRIYLPLFNYGTFIASMDNNYWTVGSIGSNSANEYGFNSLNSDSTCTSVGSSNYRQDYYGRLVSSNRTIDPLSSCVTDGVSNNCGLYLAQLSVVMNSGNIDFNINNKYDNLYASNVGNFQFAFTFS